MFEEKEDNFEGINYFSEKERAFEYHLNAFKTNVDNEGSRLNCACYYIY